MYTKDEFNKYYVVGEAIEEPIHTKIDLHSCNTFFYSDADGNMTGFFYPIEGLSGETFGLFVQMIGLIIDAGILVMMIM